MNSKSVRGLDGPSTRQSIHVDIDSTTPHYEQLRAQLAALITAGHLADGHRLPTVRVLANDLGIAPGTVARTYRDLEAAGLATTRRRLGTIVTAPHDTEGRHDLTHEAQRLVGMCRERGLGDQEIRDLVNAALIDTSSTTATAG